MSGPSFLSRTVIERSSGVHSIISFFAVSTILPWRRWRRLDSLMVKAMPSSVSCDRDSFNRRGAGFSELISENRWLDLPPPLGPWQSS